MPEIAAMPGGPAGPEGPGGENAQEDPVLPVVRPDLAVYPGPPARDGSPTFTVYDALSQTYDKLGWAEALLFERLRLPHTLSQILEELDRTTTLKVGPEEVLEFCNDIVLKGLTVATQTRPVEQLMAEAEARRIRPVKWLLHHYLYFRIPLLRPDKFLSRTVGLARLLVSRYAIWLYAVVFTLGLSMLIQRFESYLGTFSFFFNWKGVLVYSLAIIAIKIVHEFTHAYTAKNYGARVPAMGIAFIVMWPVAFCDVTDAWRIKERRKRLHIGLAGIASESVIAGFALFGWGVTNPGVPHSIFFVVSSVTLLSTLLVNLNPAMRFDGYYILMDLWGVDNLQPRSFAVARWALYRALVGADLPAPEENLRLRRILGMIVYSVYCWIYRLTLYFSIAVLVYYKFTKTLGIFLFMVEISWFIVMPFIRETRTVVKIRKHIRPNPRLFSSAAILVAFLVWAVAPMPRSFSSPAIVMPRENQVVYAPNSGHIESLSVARDDTVESGQKLLSIRSEELEVEIRRLEQERAILEQEKFMLSLDEQGKAHVSQKNDELERVTAELEGLLQQRAQNDLRAEVSGRVYEWDEDLYNGRYVAKDDVFGEIAATGDVLVYAFVKEDKVDDVSLGDEAVFVSKAALDKIVGVVAKVSPVRTETTEHLALTSMAKGDMPVVQDKQGRLKLLDSYYLLEIRIESGDMGQRIGQSGRVWLRSRPRSRLLDGLRYVYRVLIRESGF